MPIIASGPWAWVTKGTSFVPERVVLVSLQLGVAIYRETCEQVYELYTGGSEEWRKNAVPTTSFGQPHHFGRDRSDLAEAIACWRTMFPASNIITDNVLLAKLNEATNASDFPR